RFRGFAGWLAGDLQGRLATRLAAETRKRCSEILAEHDCPTIDAETAEREFWQAVDIDRVWTEAIRPHGGPGWEAVDAALPRLNGYVFGGSRIRLYRLIAEWEQRRGNDLLYATYWLRIARLSGEISPPILREVAAILEAHGFAEEARVAGLMQRNDEEEVYRYLAGRTDRLRSPPSGGIET